MICWYLILFSSNTSSSWSRRRVNSSILVFSSSVKLFWNTFVIKLSVDACANDLLNSRKFFAFSDSWRYLSIRLLYKIAAYSHSLSNLYFSDCLSSCIRWFWIIWILQSVDLYLLNWVSIISNANPNFLANMSL